MKTLSHIAKNLALLSAGFCAGAVAGEIPMIVSDKDGSAIVVRESSTVYAKRMAQMLSALQSSTLVAIDRAEQDRLSRSKGSSSPKTPRWLGQEIALLDQAVVDSELSESSRESSPKAKWKLKTLFLRVQPEVGFEIPEIAKVKVVPEIELVWQKTDRL